MIMPASTNHDEFTNQVDKLEGDDAVNEYQ